MSTSRDFPANGKVIAATNGMVVFSPENTTYEMQLEIEGPTKNLKIGVWMEGHIIVNARKVLTVGSGGNFVAPIFGPPRKIQGRIRYIDEEQMVVQAGVPIIVKLPHDSACFELAHGQLAVGKMVNVDVLPGVVFEPQTLSVAK